MPKVANWSFAIVLGVLILGLTLATALGKRTVIANRQLTEQSFDALCARASGQLQKRLQTYEYGLRGARGAVIGAGGSSITRLRFHQYIESRDLPAEFPGARGFGFIRRVPSAETAAFLQTARAENRPDFAIRELQPHAGERYVIQYVEPEADNQPAIGLDIASEPLRRAAAEAALQSGQPTLTAPVTLVQVHEKPDSGFLLLLAIRQLSNANTIAEARTAPVFGWAYAALLIDEVMANFDYEADSFALRLTDVTDASHPQVFFTSKPGGQPAVPHLNKSQRLHIHGREWQIETMALAPFQQHLNLTAPTTVFGSVAAVSLLLAGLMGIALSNVRRSTQIAAQKTRRDFLKHIIEAAPCGFVIVDDRLIIREANEHAIALLGYTREELIAQPMQILIPKDSTGCSSAEREAQIRAALNGPLIEVMARCASGKEIAVEAGFSTFEITDRKYIVSAFTDISARKHAEMERSRLIREQQRQQEELEKNLNKVSELQYRLELAAHAGNIGVWEWNLQSGEVIWNSHMYALYGFEPYSAPPTYAMWLSRVHPDDAKKVAGEAAAKLETEPEHNGQFRAILPNGVTRHLRSAYKIRFDQNGKPLSHIGVNWDITELVEAKLAAEAATRAKSAFLANMSHEIRTPMNGIIGMTALVLDSDLTAQQRSYLELVQASGNALLVLINDILDFSKIEAGKLTLAPIEFDIRERLGMALHSIASGAQQKKVELILRVENDVPEQLFGDPERYMQIVLNLVSNAIKFTAKGEILVNIGLAENQPRNGAVELHCSVLDSGIGIPAAAQQHIFSGFTQADSSTTRRFGGTGLGLSICRQLVELMDGRMWLNSEENVGSTFHFTAQLQPVAFVSAATGDDTALHGMRALIIDSNANVRWIAAEMLGAWQIHSTQCANTEDATEEFSLASAAGEPYDFILADDAIPDIKSWLETTIARHATVAAPAAIAMHSGQAASADNWPLLKARINKPLRHNDLRVSLLVALNAAQPRQQQSTAPSTRAAGESLRILLAEDHPTNQTLAIEVLKQAGHTVTLAENGREAVELHRTQHFDLILMDVQMPEMDGETATAIIRKRERLSGEHVRIIALTAHVMHGDMQRLLQLGMDDYLSKPFLPKQLLAVVGRPATFAALAEPATQTLVDSTSSSGTNTANHALAQHFNVEEALERTLNQMPLLQKLASVFAHSVPQMCEQLSTAAQNADTDALARCAHRIKGAVANFAAYPCVALAAELETAAQAGDLPTALACVPRLDAELNILVTALKSLEQENA